MANNEGASDDSTDKANLGFAGSVHGEEDVVSELSQGRFARRIKGATWTSEDSYENDRETARSNDPQEKVLWAAEKNELKLLQELIAFDAELVNARDSDLYTPLHRACYGNHTEVIKFLLDSNANLEARTSDGWTPMHCAARWNNVESAAMLIAAGADVNASTNGGATPLHLAAANRGARETLELLLWQKSSSAHYIANKSGDSPVALAMRSGPLSGLFEMGQWSANALYPSPLDKDEES